jgi:DNA-binding transcriptional LysR family regulator
VTLTQLQTFLAVADVGSVRAAAERLNVTQSAVSAALAALQRSLEIRLVAPHGRGVQLTAAGQAYAAYARRALGLLETARVAALGDPEPGAGPVRLAAVTTAGEQLAPRLLASFRAAYPQAHLSLEVGNRDRVTALLENREVDLVISGRPSESGETVTLAVRDNELVCIAPPTEHPPDPDEPEAWLRRQTWLLREEGSGTRVTTEAFIEQLEANPRTLTVGSNVAIREGVAAGLGVTLISRDAVSRQLHEGRVAQLDVSHTPLRRKWHLVAPGDSLPATVRRFVEHVVGTGEFELPPSSHRKGRADTVTSG